MRADVVAALRDDSGAILDRTHPGLVDRWSWLAPAADRGYERGRRAALTSVAARLGVPDRHAQAAAVVARGEEGLP